MFLKAGQWEKHVVSMSINCTLSSFTLIAPTWRYLSFIGDPFDVDVVSQQLCGKEKRLL